MNEDCLTLLVGIGGSGKSHWERRHGEELPSPAIEVTRRTLERIRRRRRADGETAVDDALREPAGKTIETRFTHQDWRGTVFQCAAEAGVPVVAVVVHTENMLAIRRRIARRRRKRSDGSGISYRKAGSQLLRNVARHALDLTAVTFVDNETEANVIARIDRRAAPEEQNEGEGTWAANAARTMLEAWSNETVRKPRPNQIHQLAHVSPRATLGTGIRAGRHAEIDKNARVGERSRIAAHATVQQRAILGPGTVLGKHAVIAVGSRTGANVEVREGAAVQQGCTIGRNTKVRERAVIEKGTIIGENVDIGPHCTIGARSRILDGVRIAEHTRVPPETVLSRNGDRGGERRARLA